MRAPPLNPVPKLPNHPLRPPNPRLDPPNQRLVFEIRARVPSRCDAEWSRGGGQVEPEVEKKKKNFGGSAGPFPTLSLPSRDTFPLLSFLPRGCGGGRGGRASRFL